MRTRSPSLRTLAPGKRPNSASATASASSTCALAGSVSRRAPTRDRVTRQARRGSVAPLMFAGTTGVGAHERLIDFHAEPGAGRDRHPAVLVPEGLPQEPIPPRVLVRAE